MQLPSDINVSGSVCIPASPIVYNLYIQHFLSVVLKASSGTVPLGLITCMPPSIVGLIQTVHIHTDLWDSRGDPVFDTLVYGVRQSLAASVLQEGQESSFKHGGSAEHHHSQTFIWVRQAQRGRQHRVIPPDLNRKPNGWSRCKFVHNKLLITKSANFRHLNVDFRFYVAGKRVLCCSLCSTSCLQNTPQT